MKSFVETVENQKSGPAYHIPGEAVEAIYYATKMKVNILSNTFIKLEIEKLDLPQMPPVPASVQSYAM